MHLQYSELERRDFFFLLPSLHMSGQILRGITSSWMTRKQRPCLDNRHSSRSEPLFPFLPRCQVHIHDTLSRTHPLLLSSLHPSPPLHQFIKVVTRLSLQSESERAPWQRMKGKSTGIKFQRNCLLNCGPQLLKFYPWFCVTAAVMNSVWL